MTQQPVRNIAVMRVSDGLFMDQDGHFGHLDAAFTWSEETWVEEGMAATLEPDEKRVRVKLIVVEEDDP